MGGIGPHRTVTGVPAYLVMFVLGVCTVHLLSDLPHLLFAVALLPLLIASFYLSILRLVAAFLLGFFYVAGWAQLSLWQQLPVALEGEDILITGKILTIVQEQPLRAQFDFSVEHAQYNGESIKLPKRVRLSWYQQRPELNGGDRWQWMVRLKRPHGMLNHGGFDFERHLFAQGIRARGYVRPKQFKPIKLNEKTRISLVSLRQTLFNHLNQNIAESPVKGILVALAMGERQLIEPPQWQLLNRSGTSHLVAISGLHIGVIATLFYFLTQSIWRRSGRAMHLLATPQAAALVAILASLGYALLAGFSVPTQRAFIMVLAFMWAPLFKHSMAVSHRFLLALIFVLLWDPLAPLMAGFWLSFFAVGWLLFSFQNYLIGRPIGWQFIKVQWVATLGLLPLLSFMFQGFSIVSPLVNIIAVPFVSVLILPLVLLATLLTPVSDALAKMIFDGIEILLEPAWQLLQQAVMLPFSYTHIPAPSLLTLLLAMIAVWLILAPFLCSMRILGLWLLLPLFFKATERPNTGEFWFELLDVGQGLSAIIRTNNHTLVYDAGAHRQGGFDSGEQILLPLLRQYQVTHLDRLIISHGDNDHAGGALALLRTYPELELFTAAEEKFQPFQPVACLSGQQWEWDGVKFDMLHPSSTSGSGNNSSCVLRIENQAGSLLLPGDIESNVERRLLMLRPEALRADILVAPHHGSRTSSISAFVEAVKPDWVLFAVGYRNRYGFPKPEVLSRYRQVGAMPLNTADTGQISFQFNRDGIKGPFYYRKNNRKFWHHSTQDIVIHK